MLRRFQRSADLNLSRNRGGGGGGGKIKGTLRRTASVTEPALNASFSLMCVCRTHALQATRNHNLLVEQFFPSRKEKVLYCIRFNDNNVLLPIAVLILAPVINNDDNYLVDPLDHHSRRYHWFMFLAIIFRFQDVNVKITSASI